MKKLVNRGGFTLIELIIVMAIIGTLSVVGIVAVSGKAQDARNTKRKADISAVITAMQLHCTQKVVAEECSNDGSNFGILSSCKNPGSFMNLSIINDPTNEGRSSKDRCVTLDSPCNYTVALEAGRNAYNQCDPKILFALEDGGDWRSACGRATGIVFDLDQNGFNECQSK